MKKLSKAAMFLSAACVLTGALAFAACGETPEKPEAHTHAYGDAWTIVAPTDSAAGSATKVCTGCEEGTEGHEIVLTLPVLSDAGYSKTADTATCEEGGIITYSITVDGNAVSFPVATSAKGHTLGELHAAKAGNCEETGNPSYYECEVCHRYFADAAAKQELETVVTPANGHAYHEHAAVTETCETDGNEKYYTCDNCTKVFDAEKVECENGDWIIPKHHTYVEHAAKDATCAQAGNKKYYSCSVCSKYFDENKAECVADSWIIAKAEHAYKEHAAQAESCEADGNSLYYSCDNCGKYFDAEKVECENGDWIIPKHHTYVEHAAKDATCAQAGNKKYYSCEKCTKVFDESKAECAQDAWVLAKTAHSYGEWQVTAPTAEAAGSAKKTCTECNAGTDGHEVTVELPALTEENLGKYTVEHAEGTDTYTYKQDGENITFEVAVAPADPYALHLGENTITMTDTYASIDIYTFTVSEEKTYYFTIAQDMLDTFYFLTVTLDGSEDDDGAMTGGRTIYDTYSSEEKTFHAALTVGEHKLCFSAGAKGDFTLTISDTAPATDPKSDKLSPANSVDGGTLANEQTFTVEIDGSVEAGWYCVYLQPYPVLGRATLTVQINGGEEIALDANRSETQDTQDAFSVYAYLKGGDKITYKNTGYESVPILVNMAAHEHDANSEWQITPPTADTAGKAERMCGGEKGIPETFVLPPLNDGGYTSESVDGGTKYKITIDGVEIEFTVPSPAA